MAADVAAMAPYTRIGGAHPVGSGGEGETNSIMWTKAENDAATAIRNIAEKRGRNADWAESAVRQSVSITSEKALDIGVIDLIANSQERLDSLEDSFSKILMVENPPNKSPGPTATSVTPAADAPVAPAAAAAQL